MVILRSLISFCPDRSKTTAAPTVAEEFGDINFLVLACKSSRSVSGSSHVMDALKNCVVVRFLISNSIRVSPSANVFSASYLI